MVTMGLVSLIFAAFMLYRRRDIKRLFAYSSIEHMGIIVFAFGMGGPLANFAGLLHMTMHSLTKSAIFFTVGHIAQVKGTQRIADIRGLTVTHPWLGWSLVLGVVAIAGMPPFGIFMSEFLVVSSTFARAPLLALPLVFGLLVAFGALFCACRAWRSASRAGGDGAGRGVLCCRSSRIWPGADRRALSAAAAGRLVPARRGDVASEGRDDERIVADVDRAGLARGCRSALAAGEATLLGLWGDDARRSHGARASRASGPSPSSSLPVP